MTSARNVLFPSLKIVFFFIKNTLASPQFMIPIFFFILAHPALWHYGHARISQRYIYIARALLNDMFNVYSFV